MVPAKVQAANASPPIRDPKWFDDDRAFRHREDPAGAENRDALGARLELVWRIRCNDLLALLLVNVFRLVQHHSHNVTVRALLVQETPHDL
jgi:hypothetical protein